MATRYLVNLDTDGIQRYIFGTPRLSEIRGASALLADLNEERFVREVISTATGERGRGAKLRFCAGGSVKAVFESEAAAWAFVRAMQSETWRRTHLATMTADVLAFDPDKDGEFEAQLGRSERRLRERKESRGTATQLEAQPLFRLCGSCGLAPPIGVLASGADRTELCRACLDKARRGRETRSRIDRHSPMGRLRARLSDRGAGGAAWAAARPCEDLSELGRLSSPSGYIGLVVADGNRMGERLRMIADFAAFSHSVRSATETALVESLLAAVPEPVQGVLPFEVVLLGGDDLAVFTPAHLALDVAGGYCRRFQELADYAEPDGSTHQVSTSAGVVLAHASHPAGALAELAEELLRSAKLLSNQRWRQEQRDVGTLDFMVVTTPSVSELRVHRATAMTYRSRSAVPRGAQEEMRDDAGEAPAAAERGGHEGPPEDEVQVFARPYEVWVLDTLLAGIRRLKSADPPFPRSKLADFSRALWRGPLQGSLDVLMSMSRLGDEDKKRLRDTLLHLRTSGRYFPWISREEGARTTWRSPLADLVELYDYVAVDVP